MGRPAVRWLTCVCVCVQEDKVECVFFRQGFCMYGPFCRWGACTPHAHTRLRTVHPDHLPAMWLLTCVCVCASQVSPRAPQP